MGAAWRYQGDNSQPLRGDWGVKRTVGGVTPDSMYKAGFRVFSGS